MAVGGMALAVVMLLVLPVAIMLGGAIWSALFGWISIENADRRAAAPDDAAT